MKSMTFYLVHILFIIYYGKTILSYEIISTTTTVLNNMGSFLYANSVCRYKECCTNEEIPADFNRLDKILKEKIYGQHIALETIINSLQAHWQPNTQPQKPLAISFHGWPGIGKNYVSQFIKDTLYKYGSKSTHVHHFIGRLHFPLEEFTKQYQNDLYLWIKANVTKCPKQLFIFDEVDKMPPSVLNVLKPILDHNQNVENVDYRKAIFIFLSNTGGSLISGHYLTLWNNGVKREDIKLKDFEHLVTQGAFNEQGGFYHSDTIKSNLIDHYIPFLPMEESHVRLCIIDSFKTRGITNVNDEMIQEVLDFIEWGPSPENLFSKTGCKRLSQKVAVIAGKYYARMHHEL